MLVALSGKRMPNLTKLNDTTVSGAEAIERDKEREEYASAAMLMFHPFRHPDLTNSGPGTQSVASVPAPGHTVKTEQKTTAAAPPRPHRWVGRAPYWAHWLLHREAVLGDADAARVLLNMQDFHDDRMHNKDDDPMTQADAEDAQDEEVLPAIPRPLLSAVNKF